MAKRKSHRRRSRRRLAGFGLTKAEHQRSAVHHAKDARAMAKAVRAALSAGDCDRAITRLADAAFWAGEARSHGYSRSAFIKHRKPRGHGSVGGAGQRTIWELAHRVSRACSKGAR